MPEAASANMLLIKPTEGSDSGLWDTELNAALDLIDAHDHSAGKGVTVKTAGISINADLTYTTGGTSYAATAVKAVDFTPSATSGMTAYAGALFCNVADNELYWRTTSGTNVKLTAGTSLNVSAFVGGIGGDYSSVSALVDYTDGSDKYMFRQEINTAVRQYAKLESADVKLFEYKAAGATPVPSFGVTLKSPAALAADYSITMPAAVPGANGTLAQFTTAGVMSFSNSGLAALTMAANAGITTSGTGSLTVGGTGTITSAGLVTATAGVTCGAGTHVTVSTTGQFKHGDRTLIVGPQSAESSAGQWVINANGLQWASTASGDAIAFSVPLNAGKRIRSVQVFFQRSGGGTSFVVQLVRSSLSAGGTSAVATTSTNTGTSRTSLTMSSIDHTILATDFYMIQLTASAAADLAFGALIVFDEP